MIAVSSVSATFHNFLDRLVNTERAPAPLEVGDVHVLPFRVPVLMTIQERSLSYRFAPHFHPYVGELVDRLVEKSVAGLQAADTEYAEDAAGAPILLPDGTPRPMLHEELFSATAYAPAPMVEQPYPVRDLDFRSSGSYSLYNWELFYHVPLTIGIHLSRNQRFEEAQRWFHYIFDPTSDRAGPAPQRFWQVKPFRTDPLRLIEQVLTNLATGADPTLQRDTIDSIHAWTQAPFQPHLVAGFRPTAYMFKTLMAYLQNLIDWGDALFAEDTGESVNEAMQLYVLAANLLGPRPQAVPRAAPRRPTAACVACGVPQVGLSL